ncbi:MAG: PKD domain-containing protein, partial [Flavobacteriales bacterium]|nr:PKD domain-containing protein [Flavobacteriales bacterium]
GASYIPSTGDTMAGTITLTLTTTGNGMCNAYTDQVTITFTDLPIANASSDQTVCADINAVSLNGSVQTATGGIWTTNGTGTFAPSSSALNATYIPSATDTATGTVTLTLTTTGNGLCQAYTDQMLIIITPAPISYAGNDTSVCSTNPFVPLNGSVSTASGGIWSSSGTGTFVPSNTDLNASYQTSPGDQAAGFVEIYLTSTGNGLCNAVSVTMLLFITPTTITVFAGNDTLVCGDDSLSLFGVVQTATGGTWYTVGDGTFSDSADLNAIYYFGPNDLALDYVELFLITTGNGGCASQVDSFAISIQDPLQLVVSSTDTACKNGGPINIGSLTSTGQGYWVTNGNGTFLPDSSFLNAQYQPGASDTSAGSVTLTFITDNNGVCSAISDSLDIDLIDAPSVNFGFEDMCLNNATLFSDSSTAIGGITTWQWDFNDTIFSSTQNPTNLFNSYGTHTATLIVTSSYGCIDSLTQNVEVHPLPIANFTSNAFCYDDSVQLFDSSTIATGSVTGWEWTLANGFIANTQDIAVIFDSAGTYTVTLVATSNMGCTDTIVDSIQVQPNPVAAFSSDSVCLNDITSFTDSSNVTFGSIVDWLWTFEGSNNDTLQHPNYVFGSDGSQSVILVVTTNYGCTDTLILDALVHPLPAADFSYVGFCEEDEVLFFDESTINSGQIVSWNWDFGNDSTSTSQYPTQGYGVNGTFSVNLIATSDYGCVDTSFQDITISPNPTAAFTMSDDVVQVLDPVFFTDQSTGASQWDWDFGDNFGTSTTQNPSYSYNDYGNYTITLIVTNSFGCTDTVTHSILVKQPPQLPLAFSPNGDALNDVFNILGGTFIEFQFEIYNNWGKKIFESSDPAIGWNGDHLGVQQPLGVYIYLARVVTEDGIVYNLHGDVTIIR